MRPIKATVIAAALVLGVLMSAQTAFGHDRFRGPSRHHHSHSHSRIALGIGFGIPLYRSYPSPWYYDPYPAPIVIAPSRPPVYIERSDPPAPSPEPYYWYFCRESQTYYPYVQECPGEWQRVVPQRPPA